MVTCCDPLSSPLCQNVSVFAASVVCRFSSPSVLSHLSPSHPSRRSRCEQFHQRNRRVGAGETLLQRRGLRKPLYDYFTVQEAQTHTLLLPLMQTLLCQKFPIICDLSLENLPVYTSMAMTGERCTMYYRSSILYIQNWRVSGVLGAKSNMERWTGL